MAKFNRATEREMKKNNIYLYSKYIHAHIARRNWTDLSNYLSGVSADKLIDLNSFRIKLNVNVNCNLRVYLKCIYSGTKQFRNDTH